MTTQTEALRMALEALKSSHPIAGRVIDCTKHSEAISACCEALAAPQSTGNILMDSYNQMVAMKEAAPQGDCTCADQLDCDGKCCIKAAPQGEPVAWMDQDGDIIVADEKSDRFAYTARYTTALYTHPAPAPSNSN